MTPFPPGCLPLAPDAPRQPPGLGLFPLLGPSCPCAERPLLTPSPFLTYTRRPGRLSALRSKDHLFPSRPLPGLQLPP